MLSSKVYLDNAAATPIFPEVVTVMESVLTDDFGNPSSTHMFGQSAQRLIENSKQTVAKFLNCSSDELFFTSSGTESNNLAILGVAKALKSKGNHIITTNIEHPSIINACKALEKDGFEVTCLPVDKKGLINVGKLEQAIKNSTILVTTHLANSEIGVIQPVSEISKITKAKDIYLHIDACQATAYLDLDVAKLGADLLSLNGSKAYGPRGVAVLYIRDGVEIFPIHYGGGQQQGLRSGTENVAGIVGLTKALEIISKKREQQAARIGKLRDELEKKLAKSKAIINVKKSLRLPNHLSVIMPLDETDLVKYFDKKGVAVSSGSACSSRALVDSNVLTAIGLSSAEINKTIRITLGYQTTDKDILTLTKAV